MKNKELMILLVASVKGGTGKTTMAFSFAVTLQKEKGGVILIDADRQPHSTYFCRVRDQLGINPRVDCVYAPQKRIRHVASSLAQKYRNIVIDTGGRDTVELRSSMLIADVAVIPLLPSQADIWEFEKMNEIVGLVKKEVNPKLRAFILFTRASALDGDDHLKKAIRQFEELKLKNLELVKVATKERKAYREIPVEGKSIIELNTDKKAKAEFTEIYKEVLHGY